MNVLITGGAGYIGSHTCLSLLAAGHCVIVLDNLSNSSAAALDRCRMISGQDITFIKADVRDHAVVTEALKRHEVDAVIHFAGLKAVGESVEKPLSYYQNNVTGTITLCAAMTEAGVHRLAFSSSATVYGTPAVLPVHEGLPCSTSNPYGRTKLVCEEILSDLANADPRWSIVSLRYFNPVGAHISGRIGEDPRGTPNNLMPYISQVAVGRRPHLTIFGDDYATRDGTGVRDYIHVVDLAEGHVAALGLLNRKTGFSAINLGTGRGYSVLEVLQAFERASGRRVPYVVAERRAGDVAECWADAGLAEKLLGWRARRDIDEMCADTWRWQSGNPYGYADA
ncbi:MAG: UDP-glucose 4-epimerase GalE [Ferrovibrio sp.]|uniref:UDP-glucose 4-epimerase GalE n=1 Tax=Ferrovibrio sp. TaxID=1917215 RepID=UPI00391905E3